MADSSTVPKATFLSPYVRHLFVNIIEQHGSDITNVNYFKNTLTINWEEIENVMGKLPSDFNIFNEPQSWFISTVTALSPVYSQCYHILKTAKHDGLNNMWNLCSWTDKEKEIEMQFKLFIEGSEVSCVETVLFLTSVLERSLGNVFLLKGHNVPFLLRDLLKTEELLSTLGIIPITFMQILFGIPSGINLRNVVWHGFPSPEEVKPELASILFIVTASVGEILQESSINKAAIPRRTQLTHFHYYENILNGCFPDITDYVKEAVEICHTSGCIADSHKVFWNVILDHYTKERYGACIMLLLPQLEHMLRYIYCCVNNCSERILTAESTVLYTTLDEILAEKVKEEELNKMRTVLGDSIMEMLDDILTYQSSPRIRDKLSHGECDLLNVTQKFTNHIISISLAIMCQMKKIQFTPSIHLQKYISNSATRSKNVIQLENEIIKSTECYVSQFHHGMLIKRTIIESVTCIEKLKTVKYPDTEIKLWNDKYIEKDIQELKDKLKRLVLRDYANCECDIMFSGVCKFVETIIVKTIFRQKIESEILLLLKQIIDNILVIAVQVYDGLCMKYELYSKRELRSRQRETYKRMLQSLTYIYDGLYCVVIIVAVQLSRINLISGSENKNDDALQRFLRGTIQFVENLKSYTHVSKNRYDEAVKLTIKFCDQTNCIITKFT